MELAEIVPLACTSRDVVQRLRCHNFESIRPILQSLSSEQLGVVISMAFLELGTLRSTPNLDVIFKGKLREEMIQLGIIRGKVISFNQEVYRIDQELEGDEKHEALHELFSGEPAPYKPWCNDESVLVELEVR